MKLTQERKDLVQPILPGMIFHPPVRQWVELGEGEKLSIAEVSTKYSLLWFIMTPLHHPTPKYNRYSTVTVEHKPFASPCLKFSNQPIFLLSKIKDHKTEVTSVKLVLFKYVMSFETLTKVDQLTEIVRFG